MCSKQLVIVLLLFLSTQVIAAEPNPCIANIDKLVKENTIDFKGCFIKDEGIKFLVTYLDSHPQIQIVNLRKNGIHYAGGFALAGNTTILQLDLFGNDIGVLGVRALAKSHTLKSLDVSSQESLIATQPSY